MRRALGRGLDALIANTSGALTADDGEAAIRKVPLEKIRPNHLQPRRYFDPEKLSELAASIKEHGLAQPIVVSYERVSDTYELIAGERRLRASELAGLNEVEVVVRDPKSDQERLALAMIENLQRQDLNAIEEALGYLRLMKEFKINQTDLGRVVGKSKSAISNTLRLLDLPEDMQKAVEYGQMTEGHARAILMAPEAADRKRIFSLALEQKLSVRAVEDLARQAFGAEPSKAAPAAQRPEKPADIKALESSLEHALGTKVEINSRRDPTKGTITLHYFSLDDFDKIIKALKK